MDLARISEARDDDHLPLFRMPTGQASRAKLSIAANFIRQGCGDSGNTLDDKIVSWSQEIGLREKAAVHHGHQKEKTQEVFHRLAIISKIPVLSTRKCNRASRDHDPRHHMRASPALFRV